jgi:hypothetical protein
MIMTVAELVKKAGRARMAKLSPEEKRELSRKGARARWAKLSPEERSAFAKKIRHAGKMRAAKKKAQDKASSPVNLQIRRRS